MRSPESRLDDLLADPLIRQVMASDGVTDHDIRGLAARLAHRPYQAPAAFMRRLPANPCPPLAA